MNISQFPWRQHYSSIVQAKDDMQYNIYRSIGNDINVRLISLIENYFWANVKLKGNQLYYLVHTRDS